MPVPTPTPPAAYIAWTGTDSQHTLNVQQLGASSQLPNTENFSNNGPALAFFKGSLYIAWTGSDNQLNVMSLPSATSPQWQNATKLGQSSEFGPALVAYADVLCVVWIGTDDKHKLNLLFSKDGTKWTNHIKSEGTDVTSNLAPASAVGPFGIQAIAWVSAGVANAVKVVHGIECSAGIDHAKSLDAIAKFGPALTFFQNSLYLVWTAANNNLMQMSFNDVTKWSLPTPINQPGSSPQPPINANNGPALAASKDTMYLAWADQNSGQLYVMIQAATGSWGPKTPVGSHTSSLAPALAFGSFS
jgi:hypothetical protein